MIARRALLGGLGLLAAPAIIRTPGLLMPVRAIELPPPNWDGLTWSLVSGYERYTIDRYTGEVAWRGQTVPGEPRPPFAVKLRDLSGNTFTQAFWGTSIPKAVWPAATMTVWRNPPAQYSAAGSS